MNLTGKQILKLYLKIGKPFSIRLNGQSMQPVLWNGDLIQISPNRVYEQGNIILFSYKEEGELAHRIILITDLACYCKGDILYVREVAVLSLYPAVEK